MAITRPYTPQEWENGDVITKEKLDNIEAGIAAVDAEITGARGSGSSAGTLGKRIDDLIMVQDTQPTSENNEIWIRSTGNGVQVPTYEEFEGLVENTVHVNETQSFDGTQKATARGNIDAASETDVDELKSALHDAWQEIDPGFLNIDAETSAAWTKKVIASGLTFEKDVTYTFIATAPETQQIWIAVNDSSDNFLANININASSYTFTLTPSSTETGCYIDYRSTAANKSISLICKSSENVNSKIDELQYEIDHYEVADGSITPEKTDFMVFKTGDNIFDKATMSEHGKWYVRKSSTNKIIWQENQYTSQYTGCCVDVTGASKVHVVPSSDSKANTFYNYVFADSSMVASDEFEVINKRFDHQTGEVFSYDVPRGAKYFVFNLRGDNANNMQISVNVGDTAKPYSPYKSFYETPNLDFPELTEINERIGESLTSKIHRIVIGNDLYAIEGDTIQMFFDEIIECDIPYILKVDCAKGKNYPRYWEYTPASGDTGTYAMTITLLDYNGATIAEKSLTVNVSAAANPVSSTNILCIGDSTMAGGQVPIEASRRIKGTAGTATSPAALSLSNITFAGRKTNSDGTVGWEGIGGWTFASYMQKGVDAVRFTVTDATDININDVYSVNDFRLKIAEINVTGGAGNIRCTFSYQPAGTDWDETPQSGTLTKYSGNGQAAITFTAWSAETYQPFWNNDDDEFDIESYVTEYCGGHAEVICILLGINSLISRTPWQNVSNIVNNYAKVFAQMIHEQLPLSKIILSTLPLASPKGGIGSNYGSGANSGAYDANGFNHKIFTYNELLLGLNDDSDVNGYTYVVNTHAQFDSEYGYPSSSVPVDTRHTETISMQTNAVHPNDGGYWQIADALAFRTVLCLI